MGQLPLAHIRYGADIDGLRALAIIPVLFYHLGIPGFAGGFVGVDVFFVISGFLMATLISGEIEGEGISLLRFYERRVRRIFPALFVVLAVSSLAAWLLLMPVEFEYFARSLKAASLFTSNLRFEKENGYFDIAAQLKPLLHTWSLAVEEQFYIVFPLILLGLARFAPQHKVSVVAAMFILSFAASTWMVYANPGAAFYLFQFRAWELLLGALLTMKLLPTPDAAGMRNALAVLGISMIAIAVFGYNDHLPFPGPLALLPCLGGALVIHACADHGLAGRALKSRPLVAIGLISYSLYLWHWPLIVFWREYTGRTLASPEKVMILVTSAALAILSWRFVEKPFRGPTSLVGKWPLVAGAVFLAIAAVLFGDYVINQRGLPGRLPVDVQNVYSATYDVSRFGVAPCFVDDNGGPSASDVRQAKLCLLGNGSVAPAFLVWGDSHSGAMAPAIDGAAKGAGTAGLFAGQASCPPLPGVRLSARANTARCGDFNSAVLDLVTARHIPLVFLIAYWPKYIHGSELPNEGVFFDPSVPPTLKDNSATVIDNLDRLMARLTRQGTKIVIVLDVPEMGHYMPEAIAKAMMSKASTDVAPPWDYVAKRQALSRGLLMKAAMEYGATIVDPLPAICRDDHCDSMRNGLPMYKDADHITATASAGLTSLFTPVFAAVKGAASRSSDPQNATGE